eukprot:403362389
MEINSINLASTRHSIWAQLNNIGIVEGIFLTLLLGLGLEIYQIIQNYGKNLPYKSLQTKAFQHQRIESSLPLNLIRNNSIKYNQQLFESPRAELSSEGGDTYRMNQRSTAVGDSASNLNSMQNTHQKRSSLLHLEKTEVIQEVENDNQSGPRGKRLEISQELMKYFKELYETIDRAKLLQEKKSENYVLKRRQFDDGTSDQIFIQQDIIGTLPEQFLYTFKNMTTTQTIWNPQCSKCFCYKIDDGVEVIVSLVQPPVSMLSVRVVFGAQYYQEFPEKHEYIVIFSNRGNEQVQKEYEEEQTNKNFTMVNVHLSAYWLKPIFEEEGNPESKLIGTRIFLANQTDFGSIPNWIKNKIGPIAINDTWQYLAKFSKSVAV